MLSVCVDNLVLSGPTANLETGWELIKKSAILLDRVEEPGFYFGCIRRFGERDVVVTAS